MEYSALDTRVSGDLVQLDRSAPGLLPRLLAAFRKSTLEQIGAVNAAVGRCDAAEVRRCAHAARGAAASVGAMTLADLWARLEEEEEPTSSMLWALWEEFGRAERMLGELVRECGS